MFLPVSVCLSAVRVPSLAGLPSLRPYSQGRQRPSCRRLRCYLSSHPADPCLCCPHPFIHASIHPLCVSCRGYFQAGVCVCVLCGEINQRLDMTMTMHSLSSMIEVCTYATECNKCKCPPSSYTLPPIHSFHPHSTAQ
mmetsp:Transcript_22418/g.64073  ORF Transcript_22418/g.64073 Transcript_22418/m.64073 type:complete len:138 (+) Transcript_22418:245-658(+)